MSEAVHVHDIGVDMRCQCGFVFRVPPISVSFDVYDRQTSLVSDAFNCETVDGAVRALRAAADRLEAGLHEALRKTRR